MMIELICFLHRRPDLDPEAFDRHWRERHGPLIASLPSLRRVTERYEQNPRLAADRDRDDEPGEGYDGATIMRFASEAAYAAYAADPVYAAEVAKDEERFLDRARSDYFLAESRPFRFGGEPERRRARVKLLALLKRRPDVSAQAFRDHWLGPHADLFADSPALRDRALAYRQSPRLPGEANRDATGDWDGLAEQWYASLEDFLAGPGGAPFQEIVVPDEERFLDRAATRFILCGPERIVIAPDAGTERG